MKVLENNKVLISTATLLRKHTKQEILFFLGNGKLQLTILFDLFS